MPDRLRLAPVAQAVAAPGPADPVASGLAAALDGLARLPSLLELLIAALERKPEVPRLPDPAGRDVLARLPELLQQLTEAVAHLDQPKPPLAVRKRELAKLIGVSEEALTRAIHRGEFPGASARIGSIPLWSCEAVRAFLAGETRPKK
jgi:hypothetical protein